MDDPPETVYLLYRMTYVQLFAWFCWFAAAFLLVGPFILPERFAGKPLWGLTVSAVLFAAGGFAGLRLYRAHNTPAIHSSGGRLAFTKYGLCPQESFVEWSELCSFEVVAIRSERLGSEGIRLHLADPEAFARGSALGAVDEWRGSLVFSPGDQGNRI